ncbi:RNA 2',3'-cyclic phosphodiesterase [Actinophytocola sp.]|uniref:RNA 2',3'-cyclic phosphodiesterase n=1 Tax=Actinophytocola sp. TaxID=1872138 RepID=UPI002ED48C9A
MARLFSAIELPDEVRAEFADRLAGMRGGASELKWVPPERWHITLGFYGNHEDADQRGAWFRERAAGHRACRVRLSSAGRFSGVLWIGVDTEDVAALRALAGALIDPPTDEEDFVPHVTVARWRRGRGGNELARAAVAELDGYRGRWWLTNEVVLFQSDLTPAGPVYTPVDRVPLSGAPGKQR